MKSAGDGTTRRRFLASAGASLMASSVAAQSRPRGFGRAKSVIVLFLAGGPSQLDTWDPKPDAPDTIRGETRPIATSLVGLRVGELMPRTARLAHRLCVLRAMSTGDNAHSTSGYAMLTGRPHEPRTMEDARPMPPNLAPSLPAVVRCARPPARGSLPTAIVLPERVANNSNIPWPGQDAGCLGSSRDPWFLTCDPSRPQELLTELRVSENLPISRVMERRRLLERFEAASPVAAGRKHQEDREAAHALLEAPDIQRAFRLDHEPPALRDRYGRTKFGQSALLARRLIEAGTTFVQVNFPRGPGDNVGDSPVWDTHRDHHERMRRTLMPTMDAAYASLIDDLDDRGLLEETLVVWMGEFGRTPRLNPDAGRDHWGPAFSIALAGAGIRAGQVIGATDRVAAFIRDGQTTPAELHATIAHCLGLPVDLTLRDREGSDYRPFAGEPIAAAL